jgi:hypothetical protein
MSDDTCPQLKTQEALRRYQKALAVKVLPSLAVTGSSITVASLAYSLILSHHYVAGGAYFACAIFGLVEAREIREDMDSGLQKRIRAGEFDR